ncbi:aldehyde dehydrogenase family protein [Streptomyces sp. T12]|nr:aldehyde dehydrogenase family protein [Streptomyces sp. T12]WDF36067.1 aldehyde dehydrogenase family protein [Streptomyces sp. T12]
MSDTAVPPGIELGTDTTPVHNPYTGEVIASVPTVDAGAVGGILQQARCGRRTAAALSRASRGAVLERAAHLIERRAESFAQLIVARQARPYPGPQGSRPRGQHPVPVRNRGTAQRRRGHPLRLL